MPWCDDCDRYWSRPTLREGTRCPTCDRSLVDRLAADHSVDARPKAPWHFKVLVVAAAGYLGLRALQGLEWVLRRM